MKCPRCNGTGTIKCPTCNGKGRIYPLPITGLGGSDCSKCSGSGEMRCPNCKGKGKVQHIYSNNFGFSIGICLQYFSLLNKLEIFLLGNRMQMYYKFIKSKDSLHSQSILNISIICSMVNLRFPQPSLAPNTTLFGFGNGTYQGVFTILIMANQWREFRTNWQKSSGDMRILPLWPKFCGQFEFVFLWFCNLRERRIYCQNQGKMRDQIFCIQCSRLNGLIKYENHNK